MSTSFEGHRDRRDPHRLPRVRQRVIWLIFAQPFDLREAKLILRFVDFRLPDGVPNTLWIDRSTGNFRREKGFPTPVEGVFRLSGFGIGPINPCWDQWPVFYGLHQA